MNQVAAILDWAVLYRYSLILALAGSAGVCFFLACCSYRGISGLRSAGTALAAAILSLILARLVYWYGRPDSFSSLFQAMSAPATEAFALTGVFFGCGLSAMLTGKPGQRKTILDCMSVAGCAAIALGRLCCFFTDADRGQILVRLQGLPWAWPVANASGQPEYRFATFLFQGAVAAVLAVVLLAELRKSKRSGEVCLLFLLVYSASQVLLDSTRYDSLYLRSNGFISIVQLLSAVILAAVLVCMSLDAVRAVGRAKSLIPLWILAAGLFGGAGYMEYHVQRHGREAAFSYSIMGVCLAGLVAIGLWLRHLGRKRAQ